MKKILLIVLAALFCNAAMAQMRVTGTVTSSEDGTPVPFATIAIKGNTSLITTTDIDGKFAFANVPGNAVIVVSYIGFSTQEVSVNNQAVVNIVISPNATALDEVMIIAYGTAKKGSYTGAASVVKADAIKDVPAISFEGTLSGRVAGLQFSPGSGQVGSTASVRIRGTGSMNATNEPLYVIDGVPVVSGDLTQLSNVHTNALNSLSPADIESITVLKDAAASALYGSRAANGVIVIKTKSGKQGRMKLNFRATVGFTPSFAYNNWELASHDDQRELFTEMYVNQQLIAGKTQAEAEAYALSKINADLPLDPRGEFNWENALLRTGVSQNYDLSASGGNDTYTYFASFGYSKDQGRFYTNDFSRLNGRLNVSAKIFKNLELFSNISMTNTEQNGFNDSYNNGANYFLQVRNLLYTDYWPTNQDGTPVTTRYKSYGYNSLYYDQLRENTSATLKTAVVENLKWYILPSLTASTLLSYEQNRTDDHAYRSPLHHEGSNSNGSVNEYSTKIVKMVSSSTLSYVESFNEKHNVTGLLGFEVESNDTDYMRSTGTNLPNTISKTVATAGVKDATAYSYGNRLMSFISRVEYNYDLRYFASASFRRDGSSRLGPDTRWGNFWSVSGAWKISEESFLKNVEWLNNLRIRGSYGVNGTLPSSNYGHLALYSYGYNYNTNPGGIVTSVSDPNLSWETNYTYNIGLEASFFEGRLSFSGEYFNRDSKDLLQNVQISRITGFSSILANFGSMNNRGFELELSGDIISTKDWRWSMNVNASLIKSEVTKLYDGADIIWYDPTGSDSQAKFIYREGFSPKSFYGKEWAGVDPDNGKAMWYTNNTTTTADKTVNGRPVTYTNSSASEIITGCADPDVFGGINTTLSWKGLMLDMSFAYSIGSDIYNAMERYVNDDGYFSNRPRTVKAMDRWQKPGDIAVNPRRVYDVSYGMVAHQSRWMYSGNYFRLKSLTLSYNLPAEWIKKIKMSNLRVYASGSNLLTVASQNYFDPEVNVYGVSSWQMPVGKIYTFGLEIGF